jgi:hypothetical protein
MTAYTPTTTQPITNYIPVLQTAAAGQARFDHNPVTGESLGLLIEEQRSNLFTYSEQFDNAAWIKGVGYNSTISANTAVAPGGSQTAESLVSDSAGGTGTVNLARSQAVTSGTSYTMSFYAKRGSVSWIRLFLLSYTSPSNGGAYFDLANGALGTVDTGYTAAISSVGNGWYRCSISFTAGSTVTGEMRVVLASANGSTAVPRDGRTHAFLWGAQLEAGAFPTSYIPTVAATVTRNADAASMTGTNFSSWYRADEGTVYLDTGIVGGNNILSFSNANTGYTNIRQIFRSGTNINVSELNNGTIYVTGTFGGNTNNLPYKYAYAFKTNDFAASLNAGTVATDTSGLPSFVVDRMGIGLDFGISASTVSSSYWKKLAFYPARLTNAQLQALTV